MEYLGKVRSSEKKWNLKQKQLKCNHKSITHLGVLLKSLIS